MDEKSRIVVLTLNGISVGVVVDAVSEVLRVSKSGVDALPALLARKGNLAEVTAICRLDNGKRLVSIMTARNLFDHSAIKEALNTMNESELETSTDAKEVEDTRALCVSLHADPDFNHRKRSLQTCGRQAPRGDWMAGQAARRQRTRQSHQAGSAWSVGTCRLHILLSISQSFPIKRVS